jgi:hypothetical protein
MRSVLVAMCGLILSATVAIAQPTSSMLTGPRDQPRKEAPATKSRAAKSCAEYGPGFIRIEGSDSCVRVGGAISVGVGSRVGGR